MIPPLQANGLLPLGRHPATLDEIERVFVDGVHGSTTRAKVWGDALDALALAQAVIRVCSVWVAGSFTTSKLNPGDVDLTFILDVRTLPTPGSREAGVASAIVANRLASLATPDPLSVDTFGVWWGPYDQRHPDERNYHVRRGKWDDWWQRHRTRPKGSAFEPQDALPQRGYLEVEIDGYVA